MSIKKTKLGTFTERKRNFGEDIFLSNNFFNVLDMHRK